MSMKIWLFGSIRVFRHSCITKSRTRASTGVPLPLRTTNDVWQPRGQRSNGELPHVGINLVGGLVAIWIIFPEILGISHHPK